MYYEKAEALMTLLHLQRDGEKLSRKFTMDDSLEDMIEEINKITTYEYNNYGLELALAIVSSYLFSFGVLLPLLKTIS